MTARILVVDDIEANVRLLEAKLTAEYYDVLTAGNGPEALARAAADEPDIILLDVMMPGMDGFQVCRRLKDDPATRHIPVVLVTALDGRDDRIQGLEAGADEFLTKPIDDAQLHYHLSRAIERQLQRGLALEPMPAPAAPAPAGEAGAASPSTADLDAMFAEAEKDASRA